MPTLLLLLLLLLLLSAVMEQEQEQENGKYMRTARSTYKISSMKNICARYANFNRY